jgi:hypothetical protein
MPAENAIEMDVEAKKAEMEIDVETWTAKDLIAWWTKWYGKAGHKRLGRILVEKGKRL